MGEYAVRHKKVCNHQDRIHVQHSSPLWGIVQRINDKAAGQPDTSALLVTLELLKERSIDSSDSIEGLLKGQLYFSLKNVVSAAEAGRFLTMTRFRVWSRNLLRLKARLCKQSYVA
jgi:hypothetical protein